MRSPLRIEDLLAHGRWMRRLARGLVRDDASADDVVQDAYAAALERPPPDGAPVRGWLAGVVRNRARQRWRSESRRTAREERVARARRPLPSTDELAARVELQRVIAKSVLALDEPFRSTVVLRYFEGLSSAEIARRAGVPAGTVRWRLKRGLDTLRVRLDAAHDGDRDRWRALLVPVLGAAKTSATVVAGGAAMGATGKWLGAAGALVLLVGGGLALRQLGDGDAAGRERSQGPLAKGVEPEAHRAPALVPRGPNAPSERTAVVFEIHGQVVDREGTPVSAVAVQMSEPLRFARSDDDGRFRFTREDAGTVTLKARRAFGSVGDPLQVTLVEGRPHYEVKLVVPRSWILAGHVVDRRNEPIASAQVAIGEASRPEGPHEHAISADDGSFLVRLWSPGSYVALVNGQRVAGVYEADEQDVTLRVLGAEGLRIRILGPDDVPIPKVKLTIHTGSGRRGTSKSHEVVGGVFFQDRTQLGTRTTIQAQDPRDEDGEPMSLGPRGVDGVDRDQAEVVLRLPAGRRVTGRILHHDGTPAPSVRVFVRAPNNKGPAGWRGRTTSDKDGVFAIDALPREPLVVETWARNPSWPDMDPIVLAPDRTSLTIRLPRPSIYRVRVLGADDEPVVGAIVHVSWVNEGQYRFRRGTTDEAGNVKLEGVYHALPLVVHVLTGDPNIGSQFKQVGIPFGEGSFVARLDAQARIEGVVVDAKGKPVRTGVVLAQGTQPGTAPYEVRAPLDPATGAFKLAVKAGAYRIWLEDSIGFAHTRPLEVDAPASKIRIEATPYVEAKGRIYVEGDARTVAHRVVPGTPLRPGAGR